MTVPEEIALANAQLDEAQALAADSAAKLTEVEGTLGRLQILWDEEPEPEPGPEPGPEPEPEPDDDAVLELLAANTPGSPHEGTLHGVPSNYDWSVGATGPAMEGPSPDSQYLNLWGQLYHDETEAHPENTRINVSTAELWRLPAEGDEWVRLQGDAGVDGGSWEEDFTATGGDYDTRDEDDGTQSIVPQVGYLAHYWTRDGLSESEDGDRAYVVASSVRLILDRDNGPDDRDEARYLCGVGADWRREDYGCPEVNGVTVCNAIGTGRHVYAEVEWRRCVYSSMSDEQLAALPPLPASVLTNPDGSIR